MKTRLTIVDSFRGFSLAGIVFVHFAENFIAGPTPVEAQEAMYGTIADQVAQAFMAIFIQGKFFALFSFLFGLSFYLQDQSARQRGDSFELRFIWRVLLLLGFGYAHSLLYRGDILLIYGMVGLLLVPLGRIGNRGLLVLAGIIFLGLPRLLLFGFHGTGNLFSDIELSPEAPAMMAYYETLRTGSFEEVVRANAGEGILSKLEFQFGTFSRGYLTLAFFLVGTFFGRLGYFADVGRFRRLTQRLWQIGLLTFIVAAAGTGALFGLASTSVPEGSEPTAMFETWPAMFALTFVDIANLGLTAIILSLFVLAYQRWQGKGIFATWVPYGKMALTQYILQTVIGTFIYFGWGLGHIGQWGTIVSLGVAFVVLCVQLFISSVWLKYFRYGPLEWFWRTLTYFRFHPMLRSSAPPQENDASPR